MAEHSHEPISFLAVLPDPVHRDSLSAIIRHSNWKLDFAKTYEEARTALRRADTGPIVTECCLPGGLGWRELLRLGTALDTPPPIIVTDRLADERLWAEVLNEGGYDVIMKPFEPEEVFHVVGYAWRTYRDRDGRLTRRKPEIAAAVPFARSRYAGLGS